MASKVNDKSSQISQIVGRHNDITLCSEKKRPLTFSFMSS